MNIKTSITLSEDVLKTVSRATRKGESRSEAIERLPGFAHLDGLSRRGDDRRQQIGGRHACGRHAFTVAADSSAVEIDTSLSSVRRASP